MLFFVNRRIMGQILLQRGLIMSQVEGRRPEIAAMNVFLCLLVVFIHVSSTPVTTYDKSSIQFAAVFMAWRFSSFAVQGFIFLSGLRLFLTKSGGVDYGKFYLGRLTKIVLPYVVWNVIYYLFFVLAGYFSFSLPELGSYILKGSLVSHFYFIVIIVQFYALAPLWFAVVGKIRRTAAVLAASAAVTLFLGQFLPDILTLAFPDFAFAYNDRVLTTYLFYWVAGCVVGANYEKAREWLSGKRRLISAAFFLTGAADIASGYVSFSGLRHFSWLENVHFFYCASAVVFFFTLFSERYRSKEMTSALARRIDGVTYQVYLCHCLIIFIVDGFLRRLGVYSITLSYLIRGAVVYTAAFGMCILWKAAVGKLNKRLKTAEKEAALKS